ncbi:MULTISPECIES: SRPBCC family protein [Pseudomonas]|uniref:SRPBCC family protein n=1 Tax=Pseudomonadaceae TaxID=135621 RepID=UPI001B7FA880|nr:MULTISPECIES: SRPBCC family protein [Pseudomonas]
MAGRDCYHYHLVTRWQLEAPLESVWDAIYNAEAWPTWWQGVQCVETLDRGNADGLGARQRYVWKSALPYRLEFVSRVTRVERLRLLEGRVEGDLEGIGCWHFSQEAGLTTLCFDWRVRTTERWMNLLSPMAEPIFRWSHGALMHKGGMGLAKHLHARLRTSATRSHSATGWLGRGGGRAAPPFKLLGPLHAQPSHVVAGVTGITAGILATAVQILMWWMGGTPLLPTLLRDARLTAAIVLGPSILVTVPAWRWDILMVATLIHFGLSILYAAIAMLFAYRPTTPVALVAGGLYGVLLYGLNLYAFTALYPWFTQVRGWDTLLTHVFFGMALIGGCRLFASQAT